MTKKEIFSEGINLEIGRPSKSMRKHIRDEKKAGKIAEAQTDWGLSMNQPPEIKKRKNLFLTHLKEYIEELGSDSAKKHLSEFNNSSPEEAKKKIEDFGYTKEIGIENYILQRFQQIDEIKPIKNDKRVFTQEGLNLFYIVLNKVYPEDMNYLMTIDGAGKTILTKLRDKASTKIIRRW